MPSSTIAAYQALSPQFSQQLPAVEEVEQLEPVFEDSTNTVWRLSTLAGEVLYLKTCPHNALVNNDFWKIANTLFGVDFPQQMGMYKGVYSQLVEWQSLQLPELRLCASADKKFDGFLLTTELEGEPVVNKGNNDIRALAKHLGQLHQVSSEQFGTLFKPEFTAQTWSERLQVTLEEWYQDCSEAQTWLHKLDTDVLSSVSTRIVPTMLDMRWDQFFQQNDKLTGLVDVDAFVFAPIEFTFVLLEYLLFSDEWPVFVSAYENQQGKVPELAGQRDKLRLLLFAMNVLGESDLKQWMLAPTYLD